MTEKRFTFDNESLLKDNDFWLDGQLATLCNAEEICHELNELNDKNKFLSDFRGFITMEHQKIKEENEELKKEINMLKTTIGRNEAYIQRMKYGGEWR